MLVSLKKFFQSRWQIAICFLLVLTVFAVGQQMMVFAEETSDERIESFAADLKVERDAALFVTETIRYDFGTNKRHGIYRDIPIEYQTKLGAIQSLVVNVDAVVDERGKGYAYETSIDNGSLHIKIGDQDTLLSGKHTYVIYYRVRYAFGYFEDFDELYWNVTGNGWVVPIESATATVRLPESFSQDSIRTSCYEGVFGSNQSCDAMSGFKDDTYSARAVAPLAVGEGLTVAVGFPKGVIVEPTGSERVWNFIKDNPIVLFPVAVFIFMFVFWYRQGRDPKGRGVIIAEYETPDNLSALQVAGLIHGRISSEHISAAIIELAVGGYLRIQQTEEKILFFKSTDYVFTRTEKPSDDELSDSVLDALFGRADIFGKMVKLSELKNNFYKSIAGIEKKTLNSLVQKKYFLQSPKKAMNFYLGIGLLALVFIFVFGASFGMLQNGVAIVSIAISFIVYFFFAYLMPRVTRFGALTEERIMGLKEYLQIAEKNRLEFHNAPEKKPEIFEKLLPVAMILGVEAAWAKEFSDMYTAPPNWYSGVSGQSFSTGMFVSGLGDFRSAASSTLASAPGSSSGSGGGGFSGGGGGGGGGGSW